MTLEHTGGRGVKNSLFLLHQKGDIYLWREGSKPFCHMSHVHFCVSVSTQFDLKQKVFFFTLFNDKTCLVKKYKSFVQVVDEKLNSE